MSNDETRGTGRRHRTRAEAEQLATEYEASGLTHEDARRLVHCLGSEGHHGLWIISDEAASHLAPREAAEPVNS